MLEKVNCNFYAKDNEGNDWEIYAASVREYLEAYFRRVPTLKDIAARAVGELARTESNLDQLELELIPNLKEKVMGYISEYTD